MKSGLYSIIFALGLGFCLVALPAAYNPHAAQQKEAEMAAQQAQQTFSQTTFAIAELARRNTPQHTSAQQQATLAALPAPTRSPLMEPTNPHDLLDPSTVIFTLSAHRAGDAPRDSFATSTLSFIVQQQQPRVLPNAQQHTRPVPGHAVAVQASRQRSSSLPNDLVSAQAAAAAVASNVKAQAATIALVAPAQTTPVSASRSVRPVGGYSMRPLNTNRVCCQCGACSCIMTCGGCECCHDYCVPVRPEQGASTPSSASNPTKKLFTNVTASRD